MAMKAKWSVAVIYEDTGAQDAAVAFCDELVKRFWAEHSFEVTWWPFARLEESQIAADAKRKAAEAHLVVFATGKPIPLHILHWTEQWIAERNQLEGALVGLPCGDASAELHCFLRRLAHRAGMDFLTRVPQTLRLAPESPEACTQRAHQVGSVLDSILRYRHLPPRSPG